MAAAGVPTRAFSRREVWCAAALVAGLIWSPHGRSLAQIVPEEITPSPAVTRAEKAAFLDDEERRLLRIRHGRWEDGDLQTADERASAALILFDFAHADWRDTSPALEAEALLQRGAAARALAILDAASAAGDAGDAASNRPRIQRLRAEALIALGRMDEASTAATAALALIDAMDPNARSGADEPDAAAALEVLGRTRGVDKGKFQGMLDRLGAAGERDKLDWRPSLAEGRLLLAHHATTDGVKALHQALSLNPRLAEAWYLLGTTAARQFDFESADAAVRHLEEVSPAGPLGALLRAHIALVRMDADGAAEAARSVLAMPGAATHREAMALLAAAQSLRLGDEAMHQALADFAAVAPGNAQALYDAGRFLSLQRQYERSTQLLDEAAALEPQWPAPRLEKGLMLMQAGDDAAALDALTAGLERDPFDRRAVLSHSLLQEIMAWPTVESEHFRVRCRPGVDEVLAHEMLEPLEAMHAEVCGRLGFEPSVRTTIELMPDHEYFGVRLTGTPFIHTIAASTGPVIAMEPPREGPRKKFLGLFDWLEVLRHEYTHTVTLEQTGNRIPHWLTEAIAVDMEHGTRPDSTYRLLATAWHEGELFSLDDIKWAFVRPKKPSDRALAYAQGHWMVQFIRARWGDAKLLAMLALYAEGATEPQAMAQVLGVTTEEFLAAFHEWAGAEVKSWGLDPQPPLSELLGDEAATVAVAPETVASLLAEHANHADVVELAARQMVAAANGDVTDASAELLDRYAALRPIDLWPHKKLAAYWLPKDPARARPHLDALDRAAEDDPSFALELSRMERMDGACEAALQHAERAVRISPYDAALREEAAAAAIEAGQLSVADRHIRALLKLEPDRAIHRARLDRLEAMRRERPQG